MKKMSFNWCVAEKANYIPLPARLRREEYLLCFDGSCTWAEFQVGGGDGEPPTKSSIHPLLTLLSSSPSSSSTLPHAEAPALQIFSAIQHSNTELELPGHGNFPQIEMSVLCLQKYVKEVLLKSTAFLTCLICHKSYNKSELFVWQTTTENRGK